MTKGLKLVRAAGLAAGAYAAWRALSARARRCDFRNKVVVITGGSRGLGLALAHEFGAEGARVAICARNEEELERARELLEGEGVDGLAVSCDVTRPDDVSDFFYVVRHRLGCVDVLINNAGVISVGPVDTLTVDDFEYAMAANFWSAFYATRQVLPEMRRRGGGRIVNIASIGGQMAVPHMLPYCTSKFALVGFSDGLRTELAKERIYVTTVCPGFLRTGSPRHAQFKGQHREEFTWFSIASALPGLTMSAELAARQIVNACRYGRAKIALSLPAQLAARLAALAPELTAEALSLTDRLLPGPGGIGSESRPGASSTTSWSPSWLTVLNDVAAERLNETQLAS